MSSDAFLKVWTAVLPVLTLLLGALLGGLGSWYRQRDENRKAVAVAIFLLLEIRRRTVLTPRLVRTMFKPWGDEAATRERVARLVDKLRPAEGLETQYRDAIGAIANFDPILAHALERRHSHLLRVRQDEPLKTSSPALREKFDSLDQLGEVVSDYDLEQTIFKLALHHHSLALAYRLHRQFSKEKSTAPQFQKFVTEFSTATKADLDALIASLDPDADFHKQIPPPR